MSTPVNLTGRIVAVIVSGRASQRSWEAKDGSKRRSVEVTADEVAPSLRFATARIDKAQRAATSHGQDSGADPWSTPSGVSAPGNFSDEPPF